MMFRLVRWEVVERAKVFRFLIFAAVWLFTASSYAEVQSAINLGLSVSRPTLTYVQVGDEIHAAIIVGCGDDPKSARRREAVNNVMGRCVLVLKAVNGELIRRFETGNGLAENVAMDAPMTGSVAVYPASGTLPATRGYIGDAFGRLWRLDLRGSNPNRWSMSVAWPVADDEQLAGYQLGREIMDRPAVLVRPSGKVGVIFGTGAERLDNAGPGYVVSITDQITLGRNNRLEYQAEPEWVMPLRNEEFVSGPLVVRGGAAYFTTITTADQANDAAQCSSGVGRVYGVDATLKGPQFQTVDGRTLNVKPALPTLRTSEGQQVTDGIAFVLAEGTVAFGLAIMSSPSCVDGQEPATEVILRTTTADGGAAGARSNVRVERRTGRLAGGQLDPEFIKEGETGVAIAIKGGPVDEDDGAAGGGSLAPFPRRVLYWGSTFAQ